MENETIDNGESDYDISPRELWESRVEYLNEQSEEKAIADFNKTDAAKCLDNADMIFEVLNDATIDVRNGRVPAPFGDFFRSELVNVLSTETWTWAVEYELKYELPEEAFETEDQEAVADEAWVEVWTDAYGTAVQVFVALAAFLKEAAAFAKGAGCVDAARPYITAWEYVHKIEDGMFKVLSQGDAQYVVECIFQANQVLRADFELAKLESSNSQEGMEGGAK